MVARTMKELLLRNKWQSVIHAERLWPGEYQNPVDSAGNPHHPWGMNIAYFECCTGTPYADGMRASAFVATRMPPDDMASLLVWVASLHGRAFKVQSCSRRDADESEGFFGVEAEPVLVKDGSSSVQFSIRCQHDSGVGGPICTITAFSSAASTLLARHAAGFDEGTFTVVPHGRFESTVQTSLGLKRLVRVVGIDEHATGSTELAAHFTLEDEDDPAAADAADRPCASHGKNGYTLGDHVIARCIVAFYNGGWDSCVSPTIESIMARRDHHGHGLTISLFDAVEKWFLREWTLDIKEGVRMMQATQLGNVIVDGIPKAGGAAAAAAANESEPCAGLDFVTDKQLLYNTPADGSIEEMMSAQHRKEDEAMKMYTPTARPPGLSEVIPNWCMKLDGMGWQSCDFCLITETKKAPLKVCSGCICHKYFAARYCSKRCQRKHRGVHKLVCGKKRTEIDDDYLAFCERDAA